MTEDKIQAATQKLLMMWESGNLPEAIAHTMIQPKGRPCDKWSLGNRILMLANEALDARGFKQWSDAGRKVKKGKKAFYILGPVTKNITVEDNETGEKITKLLVVAFKAIPVFRLEDTEGAPVPVPNYEPTVLPPLMNVAEAWEIPVRYVPNLGRFYGMYRPMTDEIILCSHDEITFFHELAHAAHHQIRPLKGGQDPFQEIVAETCAAVLCLMYGFEGYVVDARNYVAHYAGMASGNVTKAVMQALSDIEKVMTLILETAVEQELQALSKI
ncbi:ArdC-like ssDNA-binding domain-containing protein [Alicyclobacillus fodiniaquatilis]|uniref:ArdC-like ssDNA-binding domain-containing protein n=1 Tax=Alicyclobacillus fodiniaquatilis TaxID=1661150 RepID=A0ABW4JJC0_9BACL